MLIGRQDDGCTFVDQSVERVEKLILGGPFCRQEVDVIDDQAHRRFDSERESCSSFQFALHPGSC